jgi:cbb3-type cytochrome oxidase subunit 1
MSELNAALEHPTYNYKVVRQFAVMTVVWGIVGMLVGVLIAAQLAWPALNFDLPWLSFGRLRPLHTNAVIFAFGGSALFATSYYIVQRTCQARLLSDALAAFTFWGWQLVIVAAAVTLPLGITTSKEYAELEWPIDILITVVWVIYAVVFFGTIVKRKTSHIYVANWFLGAYIIAVAVLHIINSMVVRAQCRGFLPDGGIPRHDVLLRAQAGGTPRVFLPLEYRPLLGAGGRVYLGRPPPPALHRPAQLGAEPGHGHVHHPAGTVLGRDD